MKPINEKTVSTQTNLVLILHQHSKVSEQDENILAFSELNSFRAVDVELVNFDIQWCGIR